MAKKRLGAGLAPSPRKPAKLEKCPCTSPLRRARTRLDGQTARATIFELLVKMLVCLSNIVDSPPETETGGVSWIKQVREVCGSVRLHGTDHQAHARVIGALPEQVSQETMRQAGA